ncbi:hypothetical protein AT575_07050 [Streptococcus penaeicida]|uniref:Uncharacterized protein n=1 Tax=Streptococcus penaeicida TaxID=1765960 RepID=A0A2N8LB79_9STRE|nr:hypothetical protein [Streptococcus penaeicida]PND47409.1 hypothetical protein AT575_07050 [Streptococcus penaeicida]
MTDKEMEALMELFSQSGYLVGKTSQRDILFKYTVPIDVERKISLTIAHPHREHKKFGVVNPSGVAYTYEFRDGMEDHITEVLNDGTVQSLYESLVIAMED